MMVKILTEGAQFGGGENWQRGTGNKKLGSHSSSAWEKEVEGLSWESEIFQGGVSGRIFPSGIQLQGQEQGQK